MVSRCSSHLGSNPFLTVNLPWYFRCPIDIHTMLTRPRSPNTTHLHLPLYSAQPHHPRRASASLAASVRTKQVSFVNTASTSVVNVSAKNPLQSGSSRYGFGFTLALASSVWLMHTPFAIEPVKALHMRCYFFLPPVCYHDVRLVCRCGCMNETL